MVLAEVRAEMASIVQEIKVAPGDRVEAGQDLVVLESMKMQIPVSSPAAGTVKAVLVQVGDFVNQGDVLVELDG